MLGRRFETRHRFAFLGQLESQCAAGFRLAVERLRNRGGSAHFAQDQYFHLKSAAVVLDLQQIADANVARGFDGLPVGFYAAEFAGA